MDTLTLTAASGLRARTESLDLLANNLANAETGGYKKDSEFYSLFLSSDAAAENSWPAVLPVVERPWTDFSQGTLQATGSPLDFGLSGRGFFAVNGPSGPLYTRDGGFRISPAGLLVTADGNTVRAVGGNTIRLEPSRPFEVSPDGTFRQQGQVLGQLEVVDFANADGITKVGKNYFQSATPGTPAAAGVEVYQGRLEKSNVGAAESAVRLISVMRQFEMLQKAITVGSEMNRKATEEVARVGQ